MSDYTSQFAGAEIDARLAKVPQLESGLSEKQDTLQSGVNIKTINQQSILGSGNFDIQTGPGDAVQYTEQNLSESQKAQARTNIGAASLSDINNTEYVTVTTLPTASAATVGPIYLVGPDANNNYARWITQEENGSYSWVPLGSTEIDLSGYMRKVDGVFLGAVVESNVTIG